MIERINQARRNEKGFTLIELLIVIIVLGILAAIVVFAVGSTRKDALAASCKTTLTSIELSAEAVKTKTGVYPTQVAYAANVAALKAPSTGALLKSWPTSSDYSLEYQSAAGADYTIQVKDGAGNVVANCAALS